MCIARFQEQIPFAETRIPEMSCFGPVVRLVDARDHVVGINQKNAEDPRQVEPNRSSQRSKRLRCGVCHGKAIL